ncbi:MAG: ATP-binding cassette domain-containing protein [Pyrinomonadaceae bacterium]
MNDIIHKEAIDRIAQKEFGAVPSSITRMTTGICNEVYSVAIGEREYIFRLKEEPRYMLGSHNNIPLFKSKGIKVPEILAEDYSKTWLPMAFQIQNKLPGRDLRDVIETLSDGELKAIGAEVANVFRQLSTVPNNGRFGVLWGDDKDLVDSWSAEVARVTRVVTNWGKQTGVLDDKLVNVLAYVNSKYKGYFDRIRPYTYFGDIAGKNVMVHEGKFSGLVDLDSLAQGDPLEAIGRIKASWYGTHYGTVYSNAVMDALGLPEPQREIVTMYALLNRAFWTLENGVQFNSNTSRTVDREREAADKRAVDALLAELTGEVPPETPKPPRKRTVKPKDEIPQPTHEPELPVEQIPVVAVSEPSPPPVVEEIAEPVKPVRKKRVPVVEPEPSPMIPMPPGEPEAEPVIDEPDHTIDQVLVEAPREPVVAIAERPGTDTRPMLEASGLSKTYVSDGVGFNALSSVDLKIAKGDCVAIVGKSGSGKSTMMHLLACLDGPTEGYVYVDGDDTSSMSEQEKNRLRNEKFGFVFQQFFLNGRDTVFENVVLPMRIRGASDFDMTSNANEALQAVGLDDKAEKKAKDLSGGEKQRVCIARALITKPQVIFADEPTGNLDSNTGESVERLLFDLNSHQGITLVIVTHDPDLANKCERIVEMKDGKIVRELKGEAWAR